MFRFTRFHGNNGSASCFVIIKRTLAVLGKRNSSFCSKGSRLRNPIKRAIFLICFNNQSF